MFIGHFAIAFLLILLFPQVPVWVPLVGVSFPDLLWGILILARKEEVTIDKGNPLQSAIVFKKYPYSHSLVLTNVISLAAGGTLAVTLGSVTLLPVFFLASVSHWSLDSVVHMRSLPILGFNGDRKIGLGLWRWGKTTFFAEFLFYVAFAVLFVSAASLPTVLAIGVVSHGINANSAFGFSKKNQFATPDAYAIAALIGFGALSAIYSFVL